MVRNDVGSRLGMSKKMEALTAHVPGYKHGAQQKQVKGKKTATRKRVPPPDKYNILDGSFPREEKSSEASRILQEMRLKQPVDPRTGKIITQSVYLPTRVTEAPSNPPGSRVFSASMGRALGKFLPDSDEVKYTNGVEIRRRRALANKTAMENEDDSDDDN